MKGQSILYTIIFLSSAKMQSISEGEEKKYFKTRGVVKRALGWYFFFPVSKYKHRYYGEVQTQPGINKS